MWIKGITDAGFRRLAESLEIPDKEEAAEPIESTSRGHGPPHTLYHTTSRDGFESIKDDGVLKPKNEESFVSFSAEPIKGGDLEGDDVVFEVEMPEDVMKVKYTKNWFEKYPEHAAYIAGEDWQEQFTYEGEREFQEALFDAFMVKDTEEEWISIKPGTEIPVKIIDAEKA